MCYYFVCISVLQRVLRRATWHLSGSEIENLGNGHIALQVTRKIKTLIAYFLFKGKIF